MGAFFKTLKLFTPGERRRFIPLLAAIVFMGVFQVAGIGSIGPFMSVLTDPQVVQETPILQRAWNFFGFESHWSFVVALGGGVFALMMLDGAVKMVVHYAMYRYIGNRRYSLGVRLFRKYLTQPYPYFLGQNTSELSKNLLSEVDKVVNRVLRPGMTVVAEGFAALSIVVFLMLLNPLIALSAAGVFLLFFGGFYLVARPYIEKLGHEVRVSNLMRFKAAGESFGAIKDVKILGKEPAFVAKYGEGAWRYSRTQAAKQIISKLPSYAMQPLATGFAIGVVLVLAGLEGGVGSAIPLLAVYAISVQRLMPHVKKFFSRFLKIRYYQEMVEALYHDMKELPPAPKSVKRKGHVDLTGRMPFEHDIALRDVVFTYPGGYQPALRGIDLTIDKNTTVGFVGQTGCGKTTLVDVLMRLLVPEQGEILVDGAPIADSRSWQKNFGYVPQQIYLSDDTIAANIAFGIPEEQRDYDAIRRAAEVANLSHFIDNELPDGLETTVGERGVRFSGGQRQRVGIARALYHDPAILVMDEATSALDTVTEDAVMDAIHNLMHTKTVILIAHRISTVRECDSIYVLEKGQIAARGTYDNLLETDETFRELAKA